MPRTIQTPKPPVAEFVDTVVAIETSLIDPSPFEPQARRRAKFTETEIESLGASIAKHRLRQPIQVRPTKGGRYEIVFGERRFLATKRTASRVINCFVEELSDAEVLELQYEENHKRLDKDPLEDAFFFQFLIESQAYTSDRIADRFDLDVRDVRRFLKLNDLIREAKEELSAGLLPLKHAVYLASFPVESQRLIVQAKYAYKYHDRSEKPTSFDDFKAQVEANIVRPLQTAPFDTYDARLHWNGLLCPDCNQRTGFPGQLFPDLAANDSCLNQYCWDWKDRAHFRLRREAIAAQMPNPERKPIHEIAESVPLVTAKSWTDERAPFADKILTNQKLLPEPECEYAEISLVADGERKGREAFICREPRCEIHNRKLQAELSELKKKEEDFERKAARLAREKVFAKAIEFFDEYKPVWMYADLVERLIVEFLFSVHIDTRRLIFKIISKNYRNPPTDIFNREEVEKFVANLEARGQSQMLFLLIFHSEGLYPNSSQDGVKKIAADYAGRDYALFDAEARFELAPTEYKREAAEYLESIKNDVPADPPHFWWGFEQEAADASEVRVE